jgi:hypothetical protein
LAKQLYTDIKKKLQAHTANECVYSALSLTCSETNSFWTVYNAKTKKHLSGLAALACEKLNIHFELTSGATSTQLKQKFNGGWFRKVSCQMAELSN